MIKSHLLYQLSYRGIASGGILLLGRTRIKRLCKHVVGQFVSHAPSPRRVCGARLCVTSTFFENSGRATHCSVVSNRLMTVFRLVCGCADLVQAVEVERLNLRPRPRCFSEEREARFEARVVSKTPNRNDPPHLRPTDMCDELFNHHHKRNAVQRILGMFLSHVLCVVR